MDVWEPYRLAVGQRVRVRLSAECRMEWGSSIDESFGHPVVVGHPPHFDGLTGVVDGIGPSRGDWGTHPICVVFDAAVPCVCDEEPALGAWFAAAELLPLDGEA